MTYKLLRILPLVVFAALCTCGCGAGDNLDAADRAVTRFHALLDIADYAGIYANTDDRFRAATSQSDFNALLNAVHSKLGRVTSASRQSYFVNFNISGTQVRLAYKTKFAGGDADEQFIWVRNGESLKLLGYHINSLALITK